MPLHMGSTLNSLSGISLNATQYQQLRHAGRSHQTLNSLSGISVNATDNGQPNNGDNGEGLSIPFVGFLWMQQNGEEVPSILLLGKPGSQFPFWDFFECNLRALRSSVKSTSGMSALNSLCGISVNATGRICYGFSIKMMLATLNSLCGISLDATINFCRSVLGSDL